MSLIAESHETDEDQSHEIEGEQEEAIEEHGGQAVNQEFKNLRQSSRTKRAPSWMKDYVVSLKSSTDGLEFVEAANVANMKVSPEFATFIATADTHEDPIAEA